MPWIPLDDVRHQATPRVDPGQYVFIAVGVVAADDDEREILARTAGIERELAAERTWQFLGYDVADGADTSGLCNCGYRDDDAELVPEAAWAPRLGEHGLFAKVEHALEFRDITNVRVPEHAPFFVKALWIVP